MNSFLSKTSWISTDSTVHTQTEAVLPLLGASCTTCTTLHPRKFCSSWVFLDGPLIVKKEVTTPLCPQKTPRKLWATFPPYTGIRTITNKCNSAVVQLVQKNWSLPFENPTSNVRHLCNGDVLFSACLRYTRQMFWCLCYKALKSDEVNPQKKYKCKYC